MEEVFRSHQQSGEGADEEDEDEDDEEDDEEDDADQGGGTLSYSGGCLLCLHTAVSLVDHERNGMHHLCDKLSCRCRPL